MSHPFKADTKTFTVQIWQDLKKSRKSLTEQQKVSLSPRANGLDEFTQCINQKISLLA